ncbi:hypothetical protein D3C81_1905330 [compost metagenome]
MEEYPVPSHTTSRGAKATSGVVLRAIASGKAPFSIGLECTKITAVTNPRMLASINPARDSIRVTSICEPNEASTADNTAVGAGSKYTGIEKRRTASSQSTRNPRPNPSGYRLSFSLAVINASPSFSVP